MLAYVFQALNRQGYQYLDSESFDNVAELCAGILITGLNSQLKKGFNREYIPFSDEISSVKGKINITESIKNSIFKRRLFCSYDEFSVNSYMNRIIKTTLIRLLHEDINKDLRRQLNRLLVYFHEVDILDAHGINWNLQYDRNNQTYKLLIGICELYIKHCIPSNNDGKTKLIVFDDESVSKLYELFILKFYQRHFPELSSNASRIEWCLDDDYSDMLPKMQTDVTISKGSKYLIIDAKFYGKIAQERFDKETWRSNNLYQVFTYVKNKEAELKYIPDHRVSGMLLYAKTDEDIQFDKKYQMSGNQISVQSLDLNCHFSEIYKQLYKIAQDHFNLN